MEKVRSGALPFSKLDVLHRHNLDRVLERLRAVEGRRADPGRAEPGLAPARRLARRRRGPGAPAHPLSARAVLERQHLADGRPGAPQRPRAGTPSSAPKSRATTSRSRWSIGSAADAFDCAPEQVMMVAAHSSDLEAAAAAGLRTAFIARPDEHGPGRGEAAARVAVDFSAGSLLDLARSSAACGTRRRGERSDSTNRPAAPCGGAAPAGSRTRRLVPAPASGCRVAAERPIMPRRTSAGASISGRSRAGRARSGSRPGCRGRPGAP